MGDLTPREGRGELLVPELTTGGWGERMPLGSRDHKHEPPPRFEPARNDLRFVPYDPTARAWRARHYRRTR